MITIYTITYNEELLIQFMIDHYRTRFPNCPIIVHDNISTDNTVEIALRNGCTVIPFDTGNQFQDRQNMNIKNSCWFDATTDWVLMCDLDELLDINQAELKKEEILGTTIIKSEGYDMVELGDKWDIPGMKYGTRSEGYDKDYLFNKKFISEINYGIGCHDSNPIGQVLYSKKAYKAYHYCYLSESYILKKRKRNGKRLSPENIKNGWGTVLLDPEETRAEFKDIKENAIKVR